MIRYRPGQRLAPHFDANRGADVEDAERGGQTLATLLVYLNDVQEGSGGATRFGRLDLDVAPKKGQCLVFFPATADGRFDERVEHEGRRRRRRSGYAEYGDTRRRCGRRSDYRRGGRRSDERDEVMKKERSGGRARPSDGVPDETVAANERRYYDDTRGAEMGGSYDDA